MKELDPQHRLRLARTWWIAFSIVVFNGFMADDALAWIHVMAAIALLALRSRFLGPTDNSPRPPKGPDRRGR